MRQLEVPERAIQAFEKIHQLHVTIHDLRGSLNSAIGRDRSQHRHPVCQCVKANGGDRRCVAFDMIQLRANIHAWPEGRYHACHAGLVEWVTPVYNGLELEWILFAGPRRPGADLNPLHREPLTRFQRPLWDDRTLQPPPVGRAEADLILEHLSQLAARLRSWLQQLPHHRHQVDQRELSHSIPRRTLIRRYIQSNQYRHIRLRDLAHQLKVSEDRATHLVRECCGQSFREILIEARLKTAKELLRASSLRILEVALSSGFNEITHFNRLFRRRVGCSPNQYRRKSPPKSCASPF